MAEVPKNAKRVFKGIIFDVYQWRQKQFDGSYKTFEIAKRKHTVQILAVVGKRILVTKERQPGRKEVRFGLLGGRIDDGESPLQAAKRELLEESGLAARRWKLLYVESPVWKLDWKIYMYVAKDCKKVREPEWDSGEDIKILAYTYEKLIGSILREWKEPSKYLYEMKYNEKKRAKVKQLLFG